MNARKLIVGLIALLAILCILAAIGPVLRTQPALAQDPDTEWRNAVLSVVSTNGLVTLSDTNETTDATGYTPGFTGQMLFGAVETTNAIWIAKGLTTNDWVNVAP